MKKIAEKLSKTKARGFKRVYLQGKSLIESEFLPGNTFSYEVNMKEKKIKIVNNDKLQRKGTVSKKKQGNNIIPVIDIYNDIIMNTLTGHKEYKATFYDKEILIEAHEETFDNKSIAKSIIINKEDLQTIADIVGENLIKDDYTFDTDEFTQEVLKTKAHKNNKELLDTTLKVLSLFSGIGAFEEALNNLNIRHKVINYCEHKRFIAKSYAAIHNIDEKLNLGDITTVNPSLLNDFDLMTYGFPCLDISALGNEEGLIDENGSTTRSGLFYEAIRIAKEKAPKYMIGENVKRLVDKKREKDLEDILNTLDEIGYNTYYKVLNSKDFNIPHSRNRVFIISIRKDIDTNSFLFPNKVPLTLKAKYLYDDIDEVEEEYYLEPKHFKYFSELRLKKKYSSLNSDVLVCMTTKQGGKSNPQNFIKDSKGYRTLTAREMFAFQGFKKKYGDILKNIGMNMKQIGYMLGNSITVNVLEKIFTNLLPKKYYKKVIPIS